MTIGGRTVYGVIASVSPGTDGSVPLLGQSFLRKFRSYEIDHQTAQLILR